MDKVFLLIEKITNFKPSSEYESIKYLNSYLESKGMPNLELDLKSLIEVAINYTTLDSKKYLNDDFDSLFDKEGNLKDSKKYIKNDSNEIKLLLTRLKNIFANEKRLNFIISEAKGIYIYIDGTNIFTYTSIYEESEITFGSLKSSQTKTLKRESLSSFLNLNQDRIPFENKGALEKVDFDNLVFIIKILVVKGFKV